jgi:hypothetical protein
MKNDSNKVSRHNPEKKQNEQNDAVLGIYMAEVVATIDVSRTGKIRVFVPALSKDVNTTSGYFDAIWTSPFAGSTDPREIGTDPTKPDQTISSYGFWAVPPDPGNFVLVAFGDGNTKFPLVISCLYPDKFNYMMPGNSGGTTYQSPGLQLPTMEKNKRDSNISHNNATRPIQHTLAEAIVKQGLAEDPIRGAGFSSARRESPSEVFGILTPGPRDPANFNYRLGGHSITLDDNLSSRNIRIRTAQGGQILLDDTTGVIYMINKEGKVWMEFSASGEMLLYAEQDINLRCLGNFNIRADQDVNIEAGKNVNIKAAGGALSTESSAETKVLAGTDYFMTSGAEANLNSAKNMNHTAGATLNLRGSGVAIQAVNAGGGGASGVNINSGSADLKITSGSNIVQKGKMILLNSGGASASAAAVAKTISQIKTKSLKDQPRAAPGYNKTAASPVTTAGKRPGTAPNISTIVSTLVTAEPYEGHGVPSATDRPSNVSTTSAPRKLPKGSTGLANSPLIPADVNTPAGFQRGVGYDKQGNPKYLSSRGVQSNFGSAVTKPSTALLNTRTGLLNSIPVLTTPTTTLSGEIMIGVITVLSNQYTDTNQILLNLNGEFLDMRSPQSAQFLKTITEIQTTYGSDPDRIKLEYKKAGIDLISDADGVIYQTTTRTLVDFSQALGPTGLELITLASIKLVSNVVARMISVPVSDNQFAAMVSLATHIGVQNFANSAALSELNAGNYDAVPNAMMEFTQGIQGDGNIVVTKSDYIQRRQYEAELFSSPDQITVPRYDTRVSFAQQAREIRALKADI